MQVQDDQLIINGEPVPLQSLGRFNDGCYENMQLSSERLGQREHQVLSCRSPYGIAAPPLPGCNRRIDRGYICDDGPEGRVPADSGDFAEILIPPGSFPGDRGQP